MNTNLEEEFEQDWNNAEEFAAYGTEAEKAVARYWWTRGRQTVVAAMSAELDAKFRRTEEEVTQ